MLKHLMKTVLLCSLASIALADCNTKPGCAVRFDVIPTIPSTTVSQDCSDGADPAPTTMYYTYDVVNDSPVPKKIIFNLAKNPSDTLPTAAQIYFGIGGSTCVENETLAPDQSCTIVVSVLACQAGTISRELVVKATDQKPLNCDINTRVFAQLAYVADDSMADQIVICGIDETDGTLVGCNTFSDPSGPSFDHPIDVIVNNKSTVAYVANAGGQPALPSPYSIAVCDLDVHGMPQPCTAFINDRLVLQDSGLRLNPDNTFLYVTNANFPPDESQQTISICAANPDGSLDSNCQLDYGCTTRTQNATTCTPQDNATPSDCCTIDPNTSMNGLITLNVPNGRMTLSLDGKIAYVPNFVNDIGIPGKQYNSNLSICDVLPDNDPDNPGGLANCEVTLGSPSGMFTFLQGSDISPNGKHLYLSNNFYDKEPCDISDPGCATETDIPGGNVVICDITGDGKTLVNCAKNAGLDISNNRTFNFDVFSTNLFTNNRLSPSGTFSYAYIPNGCVDGTENMPPPGDPLLCIPGANSTVSACPLYVATGQFGPCVTTTGDDLFDFADSVWVADFPFTPTK